MKRRIATAPQTRAVAGVMLGLLAVSESIAHSAAIGVSAQLALALCLVALSTTLPLALLSPAAAAIAVSATSVVSLTLFHTLTVAELLTQLIVLHRLAMDGSQRNGAQSLAIGLAAPFPVLALARLLRTGSEAGYSRCCWPRWPLRRPVRGSHDGRGARR